MWTVSEVEKLTGVSVRALHHYDSIGLLRPAQVTEAGYRLYGEEELRRLQEIMLFRELEFPLADIAKVLARPGFDREKALAQQVDMLRLRREWLDNLIALAETLQKRGGFTMDFSAFDKKKLDEYAKKAKEQWGDTVQYAEFEKKTAKYEKATWDGVNAKIMGTFAEFGELLRSGTEAESAEASAVAKKLRESISGGYYECSKEILASLADMYEASEEFAASIDAAGGEGTTGYAVKAIRAYCASDAE